MIKILRRLFSSGLYSLFAKPEVRQFIGYYVWYAQRERYKQSELSLDGQKILVSDCKSFVWQYYDIYVRQYYDFASTNPKPVIVDCGANVGVSVLRYLKMHPHAIIHAFEADPKIFAILQKNVEARHADQVFLHNKAVWTHDDGIVFESDGADGGKIVEEQAGMAVKSIRLKSFLDEIGPVDFLKIDIEGAEEAVLQDCFGSLGNVKNLFVEYHTPNNADQRLSRILKALEVNGFRYRIDCQKSYLSPISFAEQNRGSHHLLNIIAFRPEASPVELNGHK